MDIRTKIVAIALALLAVIAFLNNQHNQYISLGIFIVLVYFLLTMEEEVRIIDDPYELLAYSRKRPAGRLLPHWTSIKKEDKQIENYKDFFLYIWLDRALGMRRGFSLNRVVKKGVVTISKVYSGNANKLAASDMRRMLVEEAYGTEEKKSEQEMIDDLRGKGYKVSYEGKKGIGNYIKSDEESE